MKRIEIGQYLVVDPEICHGKLTFKGTRIMVEQVLRMVAKGMNWDEIISQWRGSITKAAIAEAIALASDALIEKVYWSWDSNAKQARWNRIGQAIR